MESRLWAFQGATLKMSVWQHTEYSHNVTNMSVCSHTEDNTHLVLGLVLELWLGHY